ncbi:MAG: hypothetical protein ACHWZW_02895 [Spirulina sp.]
MFQTQLSTAYGWRGRLYGPGPASIPDDLARVMGLLPTTPDSAPAPPPPPVAPPALALINAADKPRTLAVIPTIGPKAGAIILEQRPVDGYAGLSVLPPAIFDPPFNCDLAQIESWEG